MKIMFMLATAALVGVGCSSKPVAPSSSGKASLRAALTFHAGFDTSTDADFARGDRRIHFGPQWGPPRNVTPGMPPGNAVRLAPGDGKYGGALRFDKKIKELVCFTSAGNIEYRTNQWSGTVSYWIRLTPDEDLEPGYCDTIQITPRDWNDASFFTDFSKDEKPRDFRLGVFADLKIWNPTNTPWEAVPAAERPMVPVPRPGFSHDRWSHVVFTWENFNTGQPNGAARLYMDGELKTQISPRLQTFTWEMGKCLIMLGLSYTGWMDDLAIFNRALSADEVRTLYELPQGVAGLRK